MQLRQKRERRALGRPDAKLLVAPQRLFLDGDGFLELNRHEQVKGTGAEQRCSLLEGDQLGKPQGLPVVDRGLAVGPQLRRVRGRGRCELQDGLRLADGLRVVGKPRGLGDAVGW